MSTLLYHKLCFAAESMSSQKLCVAIDVMQNGYFTTLAVNASVLQLHFEAFIITSAEGLCRTHGPTAYYKMLL